MATIHDHMLAQKEVEWRRAGVADETIRLALQTAFDARDLRTFREFTAARNLIVVSRCPKSTAVVWHGILPPKSWATKKKTGSSGAVARDQHFESWSDEKKRKNPQPPHAMVSDYDLMSVWRRSGSSWRKVFVSPLPLGAPKGSFPPDAQALIQSLNTGLISRIQHGCQDDWHNARNPGVKASDRFVAFEKGVVQYLPTREACQRYYSRHQLDWPYAADGRHFAVP